MERFNIIENMKRNTPCVGDNLKSENTNPFDKSTYKSAIDMLIFLSRCTRPDKAFAVHKARKAKEPTISDWNKILNILKYLNKTKFYKITYDGQGEIIGYADSDHARNLEDRKPTSGYIILMGKNPICWNSKKTISSSSIISRCRIYWCFIMYQKNIMDKKYLI